MTRAETIAILKALAQKHPHAKCFQTSTPEDTAATLSALLDDWLALLGSIDVNKVTAAIEQYEQTTPAYMPFPREILKIIQNSTPSMPQHKSKGYYPAPTDEKAAADYASFVREHALIIAKREKWRQENEDLS